MIQKAIKYIVAAINQHLEDPEVMNEPQVVPGNIAYIDAYQDNSFNQTNNKLIVSVVNIAQESSLRNIPYRKSVANEEGIPRIEEKAPEIWLNVYVLFGANLADYEIALKAISDIIGFFQRKHVFTPEELGDLAGDQLEQSIDLPRINRLIFDLYSMGFDELNQLWGMMGGKYIPSVVYKMRMAVIQEADAIDSRPIEAIGAPTNGI